ncbi:hypothetical protein, partial [Vineibacter terrae]|uniref:hypothetical protein n=1 Tax=Vineibacter terrae TaxID=2586908 RepID=UPI002E32AF89
RTRQIAHDSRHPERSEGTCGESFPLKATSAFRWKISPQRHSAAFGRNQMRESASWFDSVNASHSPVLTMKATKIIAACEDS